MSTNMTIAAARGFERDELLAQLQAGRYPAMATKASFDIRKGSADQLEAVAVFRLG